jgi:NADH-quinone oxidoreductase subunit N
MILFIALELQSYILYILAAYQFNNLYSIEAGLKYFSMGATSSGFFLLGIVIIYGISGTISFDDLYNLINLNYITFTFFNNIFLGFFLVFLGLFFKLAVAPFHF